MPLPDRRIAELQFTGRVATRFVSARRLRLAGAMSMALLAALPARAQLVDPGDSGVGDVGSAGAPTIGNAPSAPSGPPALSPPTDTLLPREGVNGNDTDLRSHLMSAFGSASGTATGTAAPTGLSIYKQVGVSETYTTNAGYNIGGGSNSGDDFITEIQPAIRVIDNTQRVKIDLTYDPIGMPVRGTGQRRHIGDAAARLALSGPTRNHQPAIDLRRPGAGRYRHLVAG
jgi:hypothetical protein